MVEDDDRVITPEMLWRVYHAPIILGFISLIFVGLSVTIFIKSYQSSTPIIFSSGSPISGITTEATGSSEVQMLTVDVEGAVIRPGVYRLPAGSRVDNGITAAGGLSKRADIAAISRLLNRAAKLSDGAKLYIPALGDEAVATGQPSSAGSSGSIAPAGVVNINAATQSELESLSGVGPVTAGKIISGRPYMRLDELVEKKVIGQALFTKIKDQLVL